MVERKQHLDGLATGLLIACCAFWGFQQILIKTTVGEVPPLWQASLRFAGATALLVIWCVARRVPLFALLFGVVLLDERLTVQLVVALTAVAVGIVLVNRKKPATSLRA